MVQKVESSNKYLRRPKFCILGVEQPKTETHFYIGSKALECVDNYRYLGITLGHCLQNSAIIEQLHLAGSRALGQVIGRSKDNYDLSYGSYSTLVQVCVLPILDYGCAAWNVGGNFTKLDSI